MNARPTVIVHRDRQSRAPYAKRTGCLVIGLSAHQLVRMLRLVGIEHMTLLSRHRTGSPAQPVPVSPGMRSSDGEGPLRILTQRERQILALQQRGASQKDIARTLHIEVQTVKNHLHHIRVKVGVGASQMKARPRTPESLVAPLS